MNSQTRAVTFTICLMALIVCLGFFCIRALPQPQLDSLLVNPPAQKLTVKPGETTIRTYYRIENTTSQILNLGDATSSCGCSVASIDPKVLPPGKISIVTVEGHPPEFGERRVLIDIPTSNKSTANLKLGLTMVSSATPPYRLTGLGSINLGPIYERLVAQKFIVETRERSNQPPWLQKVTVNLSFISIAGGLDQEILEDGDHVRRVYSYEVNMISIPENGPFRGEIAFFKTHEIPDAKSNGTKLSLNSRFQQAFA